MARSTNNKVTANSFSGLGKVFQASDGGVGPALKAILIKLAGDQLATANLTGLTDSSGGTDGTTVAAIVFPTENDLESLTTGVSAASANTAADSVMNAYATIMARVNAARALLGMGSLQIGPGTDGAGTIAAVDDTAAANTTDTDAADLASVTVILNELLDAQKAVHYAIDEVKAAVGLAPLVVAAGAVSQGTVSATLNVRDGTNPGAAITNATVTTATTIQTAPLLTEWDAAIDVLSDNIAYFATSIDLATDLDGSEAMTHFAG